MNRPTLRTVAALVMMSPYLTNSGKFLDASALFGMTVRLAQSLSCKFRPRFEFAKRRDNLMMSSAS